MAVVSFWISAYFHRAWKWSGYSAYWEFSAFLLFLGVGYIAYILPFVFLGISASIAAEVGNFLSLFAFAFVLRTFVQFQKITISQNLISIGVLACALLKLIIGLFYPTAPVIQDGLIYWHYPPPNFLSYSIFILLFTFLMAVVLLANIKNIKEHKRPIFFLGFAFLTGGVGGVFVVSFNTFSLLLTAYLLLILAFISASLFVLSSSGLSRVK